MNQLIEEIAESDHVVRWDETYTEFCARIGVTDPVSIEMARRFDRGE